MAPIDIKGSIISRENSSLEDIMAASCSYLFYSRKQTESCLERIKDYSEESIPVPGGGNRLLISAFCFGA